MTRDTLTEAEVATLVTTFPELSWMSAADWQSVAIFSDWRTWIDETGKPLKRILRRKLFRIEIRKDCRSYYGADNVPNINDPSDPTWA